MTNTLASPTMGFQTFGRQEGASPTDGLTPVWINSTDANACFRGDCIVTSSFGGGNNSGAYITAATSGISFIRGVFQGCYQYQPSVQRVVWSNYYSGVVSGSTGDVKAYIIDDPDTQFLVQGSTSGALTSSFVGLNIGFTANSSTGNTLTGYSNVQVTSSTVGSTNTLPWRIVDFFSAYAPGPGAFGSVSGGASQTNIVNGIDNANVANMVIVRLNNCDRLNLTARSS